MPHTFAGFECVGDMGQLDATSLRLVVRQFTPIHSNVRNEWGTRN